jgi:hypothetical protein
MPGCIRPGRALPRAQGSGLPGAGIIPDRLFVYDTTGYNAPGSTGRADRKMLLIRLQRLLSICILAATLNMPSVVQASQGLQPQHIRGIVGKMAEHSCAMAGVQGFTEAGRATGVHYAGNEYLRFPRSFGAGWTTIPEAAPFQRFSRTGLVSPANDIPQCGRRGDEELLVLAQFQGASGQPGWIRDPRNGCHVWNTEPQPDETLSWSGNCVDGVASGQGTAIFRTRSGPTRVIGSMREGRLEGPATIIGVDGTRTQATFVNGMAEGKMLSVSRDGVSFEATAVRNKPEGPATLTLPGHIRISGNFSHRSGNVFMGPATITTPNFRYEGSLDHRHRPHGRGSLRVTGDAPRTTSWNHGCAVVQGTVVVIGASTSECSQEN